MLFNSNEFIFIFLPLVFVGFFALAQISHRLAASGLALASFGFYGWWSPKFLVVLLLSASANYVFGRTIHQNRQGRYAKQWLILSIGLNLGVLGYFKYANFFINTLNAFTSTPIETLSIVLPLGISFFTFTQIAFLVDVYQGTAAEYRFMHYLLFVSYFPHLIAGPILHHKQMMPQFSSPKTYAISAENIAVGISIFIIGLTKKTLLADGFSTYATPVFDGVNAGLKPTVITAWTGALAYALQLYFDFSGYSDMAIGASRLFGIHLPINFYSPYKAVNIIEFWQRWHISLSQFLRDYLYIPLGGNRRGTGRRYCNLLVTMLLGGLWHGANWTFVVWGGIHGALLIINHGFRWCHRFLRLPRYRSRLLKNMNVLLTFVAVMVAWVFFRSETLHASFALIAGLFGQNGLGDHPGASLLHGFSQGLGALFDKKSTGLTTINQGYFLGPAMIGLFIIWCLPNTVELFQPAKIGQDMRLAPSPARYHWRPSFAWAFFIVLILLVDFIKNFGGHLQASPFLYFQF